MKRRTLLGEAAILAALSDSESDEDLNQNIRPKKILDRPKVGLNRQSKVIFVVALALYF